MLDILQTKSIICVGATILWLLKAHKYLVFLASIGITTFITEVSSPHVGERKKWGIAGFHDHNTAVHLIHNHVVNQMNFNQ